MEHSQTLSTGKKLAQICLVGGLHPGYGVDVKIRTFSTGLEGRVTKVDLTKEKNTMETNSTNLNIVKITGTLGRDPEYKAAVEGKHDALTTISIAHNSYARTEGGEIMKTHTDWFRAVSWGPLADKLNAEAAQGDTIQVTGRLSTRKYTNSFGEIRTSAEIVLSGYQIIRKKTETSQPKAEEKAPTVTSKVKTNTQRPAAKPAQPVRKGKGILTIK